MTHVTNAFDSYDAIGNREDLTDFITDISPLEAPAWERWRKVKAVSRLHEWQTDALAAAAANAQIEGASFAAVARTATTRYTNSCQVMWKPFAVTDTQEIVDKAGRRSEIAYQLTKAGKELKRDYEFAIFASADTAKVSGASGASDVAPIMKSVDAWQIKVLTQTGISGQATAVTLTETNFNEQLQTAWVSGAKPNTVYLGGGLKRVFTAWGVSTSRPRDGGLGTRVVNRVDVYDSDFGELDIVLDRYTASQAFYALDDNLWSVAQLVPTREKKIADTGLASNRVLWSQWTIEARNPTGNFMGFSGP